MRKLRVGDWVEVRTKEEILATLDKKGLMEGLPFMPQMFQYCGQRLQVYKRAHKTCDTVNITGGRSLAGGIHLNLRCEGEAYGGCQAACLIFWKQAWLRPIKGPNESPGDSDPSANSIVSSSIIPLPSVNSCTEADVLAGTHAQDKKANDEPKYSCQATELPHFTTLLPWWDMRQYLEDYTSGNVTLRRLLVGAIYAGYTMILRSGIGLGPPMRKLYDAFQGLRGGMVHPRRAGTIPAGESTPTCVLNLQPGELVRVKSHKDILSTLDTHAKNRGLYFDAEEVPFCGGVYPVRTRVTTYIDEKTGNLSTLKTPAIILEGVWCQARYSYCRMGCPRSIYPWWREIWLERVTEKTKEEDGR